MDSYFGDPGPSIPFCRVAMLVGKLWWSRHVDSNLFWRTSVLDHPVFYNFVTFIQPKSPKKVESTSWSQRYIDLAFPPRDPFVVPLPKKPQTLSILDCLDWHHGRPHLRIPIYVFKLCSHWPACNAYLFSLMFSFRAASSTTTTFDTRPPLQYSRLLWNISLYPLEEVLLYPRLLHIIHDWLYTRRPCLCL